MDQQGGSLDAVWFSTFWKLIVDCFPLVRPAIIDIFQNSFNNTNVHQCLLYVCFFVITHLKTETDLYLFNCGPKTGVTKGVTKTPRKSDLIETSCGWSKTGFWSSQSFSSIQCYPRNQETLSNSIQTMTSWSYIWRLFGKPWLVSMSISAAILFLKDGPLLRGLGSCSRKKHGSMSDVPRIIPSMPSPKVALVLLAAQVTCAISLQKSDLVNFWIPCGSVIRKAWAGTTSILGIHERNWHGLDTWCFRLTFPGLGSLMCLTIRKKHRSVHLLQTNTPDSAIKPYPTIWRMNMHSEVGRVIQKGMP